MLSRATYPALKRGTGWDSWRLGVPPEDVVLNDYVSPLSTVLRRAMMDSTSFVEGLVSRIHRTEITTEAAALQALDELAAGEAARRATIDAAVDARARDAGL